MRAVPNNRLLLFVFCDAPLLTRIAAPLLLGCHAWQKTENSSWICRVCSDTSHCTRVLSCEHDSSDTWCTCVFETKRNWVGWPYFGTCARNYQSSGPAASRYFSLLARSRQWGGGCGRTSAYSLHNVPTVKLLGIPTPKR